MQVGAFRIQQRKLDLLAYEGFTASDRGDGAAVEAALEVMTRGWQRSGHARVPVTAPIDWRQCDGHRSWAFHLHNWEFLGPVLGSYQETGEKRFLDFAVHVACDWAQRHAGRDDVSDFAWYDMAAGLRAYRLGYLLDVIARDEAYGDDVVQCLLQAVHAHLSYLADDRHFAAHSNHGFYQATGQLALSRRFPHLEAARAGERQARERLTALLRAQFTEEGVHREHSPDYHRMVLETVAGLMEAGLLEGDDARALRARAEAALAWMIAPDRRLVPIGDSDRRLMGSSHLRRLGATDPFLGFVLSSGTEGQPAAERAKAFPGSGYVFFRSTGGASRDEAYLAQNAAFHSRTHKHADHLAFVWHDRGTEILADAGRYDYVGRTTPGTPLHDDGFWYDDPKRVYVESTRAHNTIQIDGRNHARKGVKPFGSAIESVGECGDLLFTSSHVRHGSIRHARTLVLDPGRWLLVHDWLWDNEKRAHDFLQRFLVAPETLVQDVGDGFGMKLATGDVVLVTPLLVCGRTDVVSGVESPELLGWVSREERELHAAATFAFEQAGVTHAQFATLFHFDAAPEVDRVFGRADPSGRRARFRWVAQGRRTTVSLERPADRPLSVTAESEATGSETSPGR
ncbi:heparinase II/III family protein [Egicoccus sp. AB-alg2]|uniref:heparinase II/III domain-containing protein n=1 Tax=Egicoccus sp. AB-alg2 TaxID=3242693 RepID=UPI00359E5E40